jgi:hypothetical protein
MEQEHYKHEIQMKLEQLAERQAQNQGNMHKLTENHRPGQEGPSFAPPPLPEGWIAQWDGMSKKYYFVQLSTGASQWDTPTHAAPTGPIP